MIGRVAAVAVLTILAACAAPEGGMGAERAPPPPGASAPAPATGAVASEGAVAAQAGQSAAPRGGSGDDDIVVPGQVERQVPAPQGDPRTNSERMADIRAWDQCVMRGQNAAEGDPLRPQLDNPEETCRTQLGMANRTAVPNSRLRRQP